MLVARQDDKGKPSIPRSWNSQYPSVNSVLGQSKHVCENVAPTVASYIICRHEAKLPCWHRSKCFQIFFEFTRILGVAAKSMLTQFAKQQCLNHLLLRGHMTNLLTGLRVSQKMLLIVAVPLATLLMISSILIYQEYQNSSRLNKLERLLQFAPSLTDLAHELQKERGLSVGYLSSEGQSDVAQKLKDQHFKTSQFRDSLDLTIATVNKADYGQEFTKLIEKAVFSLDEIDTKRIEIKNLNIGLKDIREYYTTTIASLHEVVSRMAVLSDNAAVQRQIINYTSFLQAKEYAGLERAQGLAGFSRGQFLPENHKNLISLHGQQEAMLSTFRKLATAEQLALYNSKVPSSVIDKVARMRDIAINKTYQLENTREITGIQWFDAITQKIDLMKIVEIKLSRDLQLLSAKLASQSNKSLIQFGILFLVAFVVSGAFASLVGHNLSRSIGNTTKQMNLLARNDLSVNVTGSDRKDELGDMAKAVQVFKENAIENQRLEADKIKQKDKSDRAIRKAQEKALSVEREMVTKTTESNKKLSRAINHQKHTYEHLILSLDSMNNGFVIWDANDRLILANEAYKGFHKSIQHMIKKGLRFEDMLSAGFDNEIWNTGDLNKRDWLQQQLTHRRGDKEAFKELELADGRQLIFSEMVLDNSEVITSITDVTAQREHEYKLEENKNQLEEQVHELEVTKNLLEEASNTAKSMARDLRRARDIHKDAIDNISDGFILWGEDDRLIMCNSKYKSIYRELDDILSTGLRFEDFIRAAYQRGVYEAVDDNFEQALEMRVKRHRKEDDPIEEKLSSGRWIRVTKGPASDGRVVGIITDITTQKQSENAIKKLAETDALTGLPNRRLFTENLQVTIKTGKRTGMIAGILLLDLDRFKSTNDTMGHPTGDALLCEVANRLRECVRKTDTVARLGGDEFAIITSHVKELEDIDTLANRIKLSLAKPYHLDGQEVHSSVSIGITVFPADSRNSDQLLRNADVALYKAKEAGRGGFMFFNSGMDKEISTQRTIEQGLREAINENQLELYYQPQVDVLSGKVIGAEALLRWSLPERGVISPDEFIPIAETCGLIIPLGEWIIDTACRQAQEWLETGLSPIMMAVNISPLQFKHHGLIGLVRKALKRSQLDPQSLELEITEGVAMEHSSIHVFEKIKHLGVKMAIDDFGTGYSSLSQLTKFPVNRLKIDKSFVSSKHHMAVCAAIISLGKNLNLDVIAEGVETSEQLDALTKLGCHEMQGYLFAPAMPAKSFADFFRAHNPQEHICKITSPQLQ